MARVNLDDFEEDFEGALGKLTADVIAEVDRDTQGMTNLERKQYWVRNARDQLAELERLKAPECLVDHAKAVLARREGELADLQTR